MSKSKEMAVPPITLSDIRREKRRRKEMAEKETKKLDECVVRVVSGPAEDGTYKGDFLSQRDGQVELGAKVIIVNYGPVAPELGKVYFGYLQAGFAMIHPPLPVPDLKLSRGRKRTA